MREAIGLVVLLTAIAIAVDASRLGARRGGLGGGLLDMGPAGWFFAGLLLWIVAFPCYLTVRPRLVRRARGLAMIQQTAAPSPYLWPGPAAEPEPDIARFPPPSAAGFATAPAGYYPNPDRSEAHMTRWWDGSAWE